MTNLFKGIAAFAAAGLLVYVLGLDGYIAGIIFLAGGTLGTFAVAIATK